MRQDNEVPTQLHAIRGAIATLGNLKIEARQFWQTFSGLDERQSTMAWIVSAMDELIAIGEEYFEQFGEMEKAWLETIRPRWEQENRIRREKGQPELTFGELMEELKPEFR